MTWSTICTCLWFFPICCSPMTLYHLLKEFQPFHLPAPHLPFLPAGRQEQPRERRLWCPQTKPTLSGHLTGAASSWGGASLLGSLGHTLSPALPLTGAVLPTLSVLLTCTVQIRSVFLKLEVMTSSKRVAKSCNKYSILRNATYSLGSPEVTQR